MRFYEYHDVHFRGTIERVTYMTTNPEGEPRDKYANVYVPYGYDANDKSKKYNILYMMHGGGGNSDAWLDCCKVKNMLDYVINEKEIEPLIVVFPSFYKEKISRIGKPVSEVENAKINQFIPELTAELLPAVESKYNVYAENTTDEGLRASRDHRGFGGFSMGACTTWLTVIHKMAYFGTFLPFSGDSWIVTPQGGRLATKETVEAISNAIRTQGFTKNDFKIYAATGTGDAAINMMTPMIEEMKTVTDLFDFREEPTEGNLHYQTAPDLPHAYESVYHYLYTYLPYLFK